MREDENQWFIVSLKLAEVVNKLKDVFFALVCGSAVELLAAGYCGCRKFGFKGRLGGKLIC